VEVAGEEFGMGKRDRDRGTQVVRGVLEEPALSLEQAAVLLPDELALLVGGDPPVGVPDDRHEHRRQQRYLGRLLQRLVVVQQVQADPGERGDDHDAEPPQHRVGGPQPQRVQHREPGRDQVEGHRVPGRPDRDRDQVHQDQAYPGRVEPVACW
jgi:hypothetical protein